MNCPKCGNPIAPNMNFCTKCGTPVPQKTSAPQQPVNKAQQPPARPKEFLQYDAPKKPPQNVIKPQPQKPTVQPTYTQNNSPKVQPQPAPQNVVIQPQKPPKKKKSNKNLPLIIVAVVLVFAVLASTIAVVPGIIRNKNEINAATEYIEEFPTLKQRTALLVYDINKFPSEKYEIKVEKMFMGGVLNGVFKGKTILEDVSTEHIYDIDFKEDGDYRITLTDKTEPIESTETEVIEIVIIIDVKVDNDAEDAVDSVDIHSPENPAVQYLEATKEDFELLRIVLGDVCTWTDEYKPEDPDANKIAVNSMLSLFNDGYRSCAEKYGLVSPEGISNTEFQDPQKKYISDDYSGYYKYPEADVNWLVKNMFNVDPKETESWETYSYDDGTEETVCLWYNQDGYYYSYFIVTGADIIRVARIDESSLLEDGTYDISVIMLEKTIYDEDETGKPIGNYKVVAGLKEVDGKRVWSLKELKKIDDADKKQPTSTVVPVETTEPTTSVAMSEATTANKPVAGQQTENPVSNNTETKKNVRLVEMVIKKYGTVKIELYPDEAPITVENFVTLARSGFYDGVGFHRLDKDFVLQGGDPDGDGVGGSGKKIKGEFASNGVQNNISHKRGVISMARTNDPDSASSQFFICLEDSTSLDGNYAAFGYVTEGMNIIDKIRDNTPESNSIPKDQQPIIETIRVIN